MRDPRRIEQVEVKVQKMKEEKQNHSIDRGKGAGDVSSGRKRVPGSSPTVSIYFFRGEGGGVRMAYIRIPIYYKINSERQT